jgi:hypothetical protein
MNTTHAQDGALLDEVNIHDYAKRGERPPPARSYRFLIDRQPQVWPGVSITGRDLLKLAMKIPPERFGVRQKFSDGRVKAIGLDEKVDLTTPGIEHFFTFPREVVNG